MRLTNPSARCVVVRAIALAAAVATAPPGFAVASNPEGVSPGSPTGTVLAASSCPGFSWSGGTGTAKTELVVYELGGDAELPPVLQVELPGDARSWTPPSTQCPAPGAEYAWTVRTLTADGPGTWSQLLLFSTPAAPTEDEARQALETLRRHRRTASAQAPSPGRGNDAAPPPREGAGRSPARPSAALHAEEAHAVGSDPGRTSRGLMAPSSFSLSVSGDFDLGGFVFRSGNSFIHNLGGNTAVGTSALAAVMPNFFSQKGLGNSAFGNGALISNTEGNGNTAIGHDALSASSSGSDNTALGRDALVNSTGQQNTALGAFAGENWTDESYNIAVGYAVRGQAGDQNTIRIGGNVYERTFIGGIYGTTPQESTTPVVIDIFGQLGVQTSSARFKQDIQDLQTTHRLLDLRPVSFRYRPKDGSESQAHDGPLEYGLIAEEVAEVFPELVIRDDEGLPLTVRYQLLAPLLLAEFQRQERELTRLRQIVERLSASERRSEVPSQQGSTGRSVP